MNKEQEELNFINEKRDYIEDYNESIIDQWIEDNKDVLTTKFIHIFKEDYLEYCRESFYREN